MVTINIINENGNIVETYTDPIAYNEAENTLTLRAGRGTTCIQYGREFTLQILNDDVPEG